MTEMDFRDFIRVCTIGGHAISCLNEAAKR
jgi:hypothetical protein